MINKIPIELEPPSPMPTPPLRKKPTLIPQFNNQNQPSLVRLLLDERWN